MIKFVLASLIFAQQSGQVAITVPDEDPLTWTLEYPFAIEPYVEDYYNCLRSQEMIVGPGRSFESAHLAAVPLCTKVEERSLKDANAALARIGRNDELPASEVASLFDKIRLIHAARGKDLDDQMLQGLGGDPYVDQIATAELTEAQPDEMVTVQNEVVQEISGASER